MHRSCLEGKKQLNQQLRQHPPQLDQGLFLLYTDEKSAENFSIMQSGQGFSLISRLFWRHALLELRLNYDGTEAKKRILHDL